MFEIERLNDDIKLFRKDANSFIVTEHDDSLTVEMQLRSFLKKMREIIGLNNTLLDTFDKFQEYVLDMIKNEFEEIRDWLKNEGLTNVVLSIFSEWVTSGKMQDLLNPMYEQMFYEWFESIKEILKDGDVGNVIIALNELSNKLDKLTYYVTPEQFGAFGDGVRDDSDSLNQMFAFAKENGLNVKFRPKKYRILDTININGDNILVDFNKATIIIDKEYSDNEDPITAILITGDFKFSTLNNLNLKSVQLFKHYGIIVDVGKKWIEYNNLNNIHVSGFIDCFKVKMGGGTSTESGIVYNNFTNCSFTNFSNNGIYIEQNATNTGNWMNQNTFINCKFSNGKNGFTCLNVSVQNLIFNQCSFEILGFHNTSENQFDSAYGFKGNKVTSVYFTNSYFENISPHRVATLAEITSFTNSNETSSAGNKKIGNYELFYDYYNQTIRPIGVEKGGNYGNVIVDNVGGVYPKIVIDGSIISMSVNELVCLRDSEISFTNNKLYHPVRRPNACYQGVLSLHNKVNNPHKIISKGNRFSAERMLSKFIDIVGILGSNSTLEGDFFENDRSSDINVTPTNINNIKNLYLDTTNGNDLNIGVLKNYPCRTIDQIIWRLNLINDDTIVNVNIIGDFTIDKLFTITNKKVNFLGSGTIFTKEIVNQNNGFYYITIKNSRVSFSGFTIELLDLSDRPSFVFNFMLLLQEKNTIEFNNCFLKSSDDSFPSLINNTNGDLYAYFNNCQFTEGGSIIRGYNSDTRVKNIIIGNTDRWQYPKTIGPSEDRPKPKYLTAGVTYYDTTLNKPIYYNGSNWVDYSGDNV